MDYEIVFKYATTVKLKTETGEIALLVRPGTTVEEYDWKNGPNEQGMVQVSFNIPLGDNNILFSGLVQDSLLYGGYTTAFPG